MARDIVAASKRTTNSDAAETTVAINATNGATVAHGKHGKTLIVVTNTSGATKVVTVRRNAWVADPMPADYTTAPIAATTGRQVLGPFSAHYTQADGSVWLDFVAGHTGTVSAYELP